MSDGVAARLVDPDFDERLMVWFHRLGPAGFVTFMSGGVAARLVDPAFDARLMVWFNILGPAGFVTFMSDGVAARLVDPAFDARLMVWYDRLQVGPFIKFIKGGVAARILDADFNEELTTIWWDRFNNADQFARFIKGCCGHLLDPHFRFNAIQLMDIINNNEIFSLIASRSKVSTRIKRFGYVELITNTLYNECNGDVIRLKKLLRSQEIVVGSNLYP